MSLGLVVVGKDWGDLEDFSRRNQPALGPLGENAVFLRNGSEMTYGGQARIWPWIVCNLGTDVVGMVHADTALSSEFLAEVERACLSGPVVAGLVGRSLGGFYVWAPEVRGAPAEVSTLDGCSVFASLATARRPDVQFDGERFDGFHCAVEDFCLTAARAGCRVVVPPGEASHRGSSTQDPAWLRAYSRYRYALAEKWQHTLFLTT